MTAASSDYSRVASLDGFRALSIGLVLFSHCLIYQPHHGLLIGLATACGSVGVTLFFVLSGYLITTLLIKERSATGTISIRNFYARRALRILPAYSALVATLVLLVAVGVLHSMVTRDAVISLFFARNIAGRTHETAHLWSLSLEEQFYALWPLSFLLLAWRAPVVTTSAAIGALWVWRLVRWWMADIPIGVLYLRSDMRFDSILIGCLLAMLLRETAPTRMLRLRWPSLIALIGLVLAVLIAWFARADTLLYLYKHTLVSSLGAVALATILIAPRFSVARILSVRPVAWVGKLSYSLYLWQQLFLGPAEGGLANLRSVPLCGLIASLLAAIVSYYAIEMPFLRYKSRFAFNTRPEPAYDRPPTGYQDGYTKLRPRTASPGVMFRP